VQAELAPLEQFGYNTDDAAGIQVPEAIVDR